MTMNNVTKDEIRRAVAEVMGDSLSQTTPAVCVKRCFTSSPSSGRH